MDLTKKRTDLVDKITVMENLALYTYGRPHSNCGYLRTADFSFPEDELRSLVLDLNAAIKPVLDEWLKMYTDQFVALHPETGAESDTT